MNGLKASGSNSSEIEAALKQPVLDEDTQKAAAGTKQIISAIVEVSKVFEPKTPPEADAFQSATINEAMKLLDVVTYVPSDMASGILGVLDSFMTSSGK